MKPNTMRAPNLNQAGFGYIEAMAALGMAIALFLLSMQVTSQSTDILETTTRRQVATNISYDVMNSLLYVPANDSRLVAGTEFAEYFSYYARPVTVNQQNPDYEYKVSWTVTDDTPVTGMKTIQMVTSWKSGAFSKTMRFVTYRAM